MENGNETQADGWEGSDSPGQQTTDGSVDDAGGEDTSQGDPKDGLEPTPPREPVENHPEFQKFQGMAQVQNGNGAGGPELTGGNDPQPPEKERSETVKGKNVLDKIMTMVQDMLNGPTDEESLKALATYIKHQDWSTYDKVPREKRRAFMEEWKKEIKEWKLSPQRAATLASELEKDWDSNGNQGWTIRQMGTNVKEVYPVDPTTQGGNRSKSRENAPATILSEEDRIYKMSGELKTVQNRPDQGPHAKAWKEIMSLEPGREPKRQATEVEERSRIMNTIQRATDILIPAVIMITKPPITSQIITILTILTIPACGMLTEPGDTMKIKDIRASLHEDETGQRLLSIIWKKEDVEFNHHTEFSDYSDFAEMEVRLENLTDALKASGRGQANSESMGDKLTRRHCDCVLSTDYPSQETNKTWVMPHEETYGSMCTVANPFQTNKYEVTVRATEQGPECTISPTNETKHKIEEANKTPSEDLVQTLNQNRRHPCITRGAYNLNRIPRGAITTKTTEKLIECILHCTFSSTCTSWMFHETRKTCWILSIARKYQFAEATEPWTKLYTGQRSCTPCGLAAKIELPDNDHNMWEDRCTLTLDTNTENPLKCPCDPTATYRENIDKLETAIVKNKRNSIREAVYQNVRAKLTDAIAKAMEGPAKAKVGAYLTKLMSVKPEDIKKAPRKILQGIEPSGDLMRLLSKAIELTAEVARKYKRTTQKKTTTTTNQAAHGKKGQIEALLKGELQTKGAILKALTLMEELITTAGTQKQLAMKGSENIGTTNPGEDKATIRISADWGNQLSITTLTPITQGKSRTAATICPIPMSLDKDLKEGPALEGELDPTMIKQEENWKKNCMQQIVRGDQWLKDCNPGGQPQDWRTVWKTGIPTETGALSVVRITSRYKEKKTYIMDCNGKLSTVTAQGTTVLLVEAGCEMKTSKGEQFTGEHMGHGSKGATYWILYQAKLEWEYTQEQKTDIWHTTAIALILLVIAADTGRRWMMKHCKTSTPTPNPQQGSPREPRPE